MNLLTDTRELLQNNEISIECWEVPMQPKHWQWQLMKGNNTAKKPLISVNCGSHGYKWAINDMIQVDINSHQFKDKDIIFQTSVIEHTINIGIKDYWNNCEDVWNVEFITKHGPTDNNIIQTCYTAPIYWYWNK